MAGDGEVQRIVAVTASRAVHLQLRPTKPCDVNDRGELLRSSKNRSACCWPARIRHLVGDHHNSQDFFREESRVRSRSPLALPRPHNLDGIQGRQGTSRLCIERTELCAIGHRLTTK